LSGCGLFGGDTPQPACPRAAILDQARTTSLYREGAEHTFTNVTYELNIITLSGVCEYDVDEGRTTVNSVLTIGLEAKRGPAGKALTVELPYFVAIADPERRIIAKEVFRSPLVFTETGVRSQRDEEVEQEIPVSPQFFGGDYHIFVGLQLSRDQLEENLKRRQR
jgi:hypothetical protein